MPAERIGLPLVENTPLTRVLQLLRTTVSKSKRLFPAFWKEPFAIEAP
jgi:hypothetical protein